MGRDTRPAESETERLESVLRTGANTPSLARARRMDTPWTTRNSTQALAARQDDLSGTASTWRFGIGGGTGGGRPMRARFAALARGSQRAVVKLASYGSGVRAAAMMNYASRSGELPVENEKGERIVGLPALNDLRAEWEHLFDNRAASRDVGLFAKRTTCPK